MPSKKPRRNQKPSPTKNRKAPASIPTPEALETRSHYLALTEEEASQWQATRSLEDLERFRFNPIFHLRDDQVAAINTDPQVRYDIVCTGRMWGKSKLGAAFTKMVVDAHPGEDQVIAIMAPIHAEFAKVIVPALRKEFPPDEQPEYNEQKGIITFANGATAHTWASDTEARGGNYRYAWVDEVAKFCGGIESSARESFNTLDFAVRIGEHPKILVTTTPKPWGLFRRWQERARAGDPLVKLVGGSHRANFHIGESTHRALENEYAGTAFGDQELEGRIELAYNPLALWNMNDFHRCRVAEAPPLRSIRVAMDPATTSKEGSDHTGIIVAGISYDNRGYVLEDATLKAPPDVCAQRAVELFMRYHADAIVVEVNNGGDWIPALIKTVNPGVPVLIERATRNKETRAQPIANLYKEVEQGNIKPRIFHVGPAANFRRLEEECCEFEPGARKSPDRMDALVWAMHSLFFRNAATSGSDLRFMI